MHVGVVFVIEQQQQDKHDGGWVVKCSFLAWDQGVNLKNDCPSGAMNMSWGSEGTARHAGFCF